MTTLTPDTAPEAVLHLAKGLARRFTPWGALEWQDYVGLACLGFYEARARWPGWGDFKRYALRCMDGAIREARRQEARHQLGTTARSSKAVGLPFSRKSRADGCSALPLVSTPRYRRPGTRQEHNRTYYYQHYELYAQRDYQRHVKRLGAQALSYDVWWERRERNRRGLALQYAS